MKILTCLVYIYDLKALGIALIFLLHKAPGTW